MSQSPMMKRVQGPKNRFVFHLPKKGSLRILFSLVIVIICVRFTSGLLNGNSEPTKDTSTHLPVKDSLPVVNNPNPQTSSKNTTENPPSKKPFSFFGFGKNNLTILSYDDVAELLRDQQLHIGSVMDTIIHDGDTLVIHYTIDTILQKYATALMKQYHPKYGGLAVIDPYTGRTLALVSYTNDNEPALGTNLYCRSTFPAASVFKTITAAAAIEKASLTSQSLLPHVGHDHTLYRFQLVKDLPRSRNIALIDAYAMSVNPVFARIGMYLLDKKTIDEYGAKFGFFTSIPFELPNDSSVIAVPDSDCSMAELASGYNRKTAISPLHGALIAAAISENGRMIHPYLVDSITMLRSDSCIYRASSSVWCSPIQESTARELRTMMQKVAQSGTARKAFFNIRRMSLFNDMEFGGKTGSVDQDNGGHVDWFIGFARSNNNSQQRIAAGVVTVHGENWTVHSSFIAAEMFRLRMQTLKEQERTSLAHSDPTSLTKSSMN